MLTKNFVGYLYTCSSYDGARQYRINTVLKDTEGKEWTAPANSTSGFWLKTFLSAPAVDRGAFWLVLGDDATAVKKDDYKLGNELTGLTAGVGDYIFNNDTGRIRIYRTYANDTSNDIEVSEVGLAVRASTNAGDKNILIAREVLAKPITIKANGGVQVLGIDLG